MFHPVKRLELAAAQRPGLRRLGVALKHLSPLFASGTMAAVYLTSPGALTYANLAFYALAGLTVGGLGVREISRGFQLAAGARKLGEAEQLADQLRWINGALAGELTELVGEDKVAELQKVPFDGHNIVVGKVGEGGMAIAIKVKNVDLGGQITVWKMPLPAFLSDPEVLARFSAGEAKTMANLSHPNLVRYFDHMNISGSTYLELLRLAGSEHYQLLKDSVHLIPKEVPGIKMELVQGQSLDKMIEEKKRLAPALAVKLAIDIAAGADFVAKKGTIHRDLKPENVMVVPAENQTDILTVKIMDFGLAKQAGPLAKKTDLKLTQEGRAIGTPYYMSPEQWSGAKDIDWRTDQYALGIILFEMLAGELPFRGDVDASGGENISSLISRVMCEQLPDLKTMVPGLPDKLVETVNRMLAKNREDRFQSWEECLAALRSVSSA